MMVDYQEVVHQRYVDSFQEIVKILFPLTITTDSTLSAAVDVADDGSPQSATVKIEGVPVMGIIDTGSDITIISGDMFKTVIAKAGLKKEEFKTTNKQAFTYNKQQNTLDGQMDVDISFEDKQVHTTIYVKTEASDPLLLSEAICRQLGIIHYHPNVKTLDGNRESEAAKQSTKTCSKQALNSKVKMIQTVRLAAQHTAVMPVKIDGNEGTLLLEPGRYVGY